MPESIVETSDGVVLIANGIDPVLRWDGYAAAATIAGVFKPTAAGTIAASGAGTITGEYDFYVRYVDVNGHFSDVGPVSNSVAAVNALTINYSNLPTPSQPSVVRRQILRNTAGQKLVYYVDIDTTDLGSLSLSSTRVDANLATQEAAPLFDTSNVNIINLYAPPPDFKPFMTWHQNRMHFAGVKAYSIGSVRCSASFGNVAIGAGTEWKPNFVGRLMYINGADKTYTISAVDEPNQIITFAETYTGDTILFASYSIKPEAIEEVTTYFSEPYAAEAVPRANAYSIPQDGDVVTGQMNYKSFLHTLKRRKMYKLTTKDNPVTDGHIYLGINRGCINNRCWVVADEVAYLLDEAGVYAYKGDNVGDTATQSIQDIFRREGFGTLQINWSASDKFHASHSPQEEVVRFFVALADDIGPRHALVYGYSTQRWWVEEYPIIISASCLGRSAGFRGTTSSGSEQVYLGTYGNKIVALSPSGIDGVVFENAARSRVTSSDLWGMADTGANFASVAGASIAIVTGRAAGQLRTIVESTGTTLRIDRPWDVLPAAGDVYQVGGVNLLYRSRRARYVRSETTTARSCELNYYPLPLVNPKQTMTMRMYDDYSSSGKTNSRSMDTGMSSRIVANQGEAGVDIDLSGSGYQQQRFDGGFEQQTDAPKTLSLELSGIGGPSRIRINSLLLVGVVR